MSRFLTLEDLDEGRQPKSEWLRSRRLHGILFIEVPGQEGFENLVGELGSNVEKINVLHAEFGHPLRQDTFNDTALAYKFIFSVSYEDIFIELIYNHASFILWMPQEHRFYALFGQIFHLRICFQGKITTLEMEFDEYMNALIFNERAKMYLAQAKGRYFTARDVA